MKSRQVTRWKCDYCPKSGQVRSRIALHEKHCFRNPDRSPWLGELTDCMNADETWWPGEGKIWNGARWCDVPGYDSSRVEWPMVTIGGHEDGMTVRLNEIRNPWSDRLKALGYEEEVPGQGDGGCPF
jgi:hypothetical protein